MLKVYELWERDTVFNIHKKIVVTNIDLYEHLDEAINLFKEYFYCYDEYNHSFHEVRGARIIPIMKVNPIENTELYNWDVGFEVHTDADEWDHAWYFAFECGNDAVLPIAVNQAQESLERLIEWRNNNDGRH